MNSVILTSAPNSAALEARLPAAMTAVLPRLGASEAALLGRALEKARALYGDARRPTGEGLLEHALGVMEILNLLRLDSDALAAALLMDAHGRLENAAERLAAEFSPAIARLTEGVARMGQIHALSGTAAQQGQAEALRKMLLAMVEDLRVVLIKLADQLQTLRALAMSETPDEAARAIARETLDIFAPLANRLGVWQLKWELEDRAFSLLEPALYRKIAAQLDERRVDRERYIGRVVAALKEELARAGVQAEITGRPKHIYSIVKKMRRKRVPFEEIYDARAVRILVKEVKDCYTALGVVHNLWTPIPKEFDDYIAKPKGNHYRSLHTAVIGPEGKALEVQIRTFEMHQHSELGVAAHWRYKEGGREDPRYDDKIAWVRQLLEWKEELADSAELAEQFKTALFQDTVYVLTPQGRVIDLPRGSTPVDFAYAVHTDLGHRCRGARVNGAIVPLTYRLENGQRVEIIAAKQGGPSRDWLNPELGYLRSPRARAKVRQYFKSQELAQTLAEGRAIVERELSRRGLAAMGLEQVAQRLHFSKVEDLFAAVARGDVNHRALAQALGEKTAPAAPEEALGPRPQAAPSATGILVGGVGDLLTVFARCCRPAPPDPILGYVTRGRGVSVHRRGCATLAKLIERHPDRVMDAAWRVREGMTFETDVVVEANDRPGLLRDIYEVVARERINITAANTHTRGSVAHMFFTLRVANLEQLKRLLALVREVPGVVHAVRH
ncbi:RelA/SpoT family protein [Pelomicrobium sp. G1]|uniref:RelA/SpoT family protein n=1 Tax=unclassified Pelomicrobium TaxID=2815318 RepID=UPI003F76D10A